MKGLGDFDLSTVVYGKFTTFRPSSGAAYTLAGTPALSVYKDNSVTQSTSGVTLTADFDSVTGLNHFAIDTSSDGTFYSAGSFFDVVITTGTVDSVSVVGSVVASFTLRKTSSLKPTTAGRALDVSAGGEAGIDWANIGSPTTAVNLSSTNIDVDQVVASVSGAVGSVTGAVGSVTGAVGSVTGNVGGNVVGSVGSVVGAVGSVTGAVGSVTGNVGGNVTGSVGSVVGAVGSVTGNVGGNVSGSVGSVAAGGIAAASFAANAIDASALAASGVSEIAGAVWDVTLASHVGAGSTGEALNAAGAAGDPWITALPGAYAAGSAGKIIGSLTFTQAGQVDANIQYVNNVQVNGTGAPGNEWGP